MDLGQETDRCRVIGGRWSPGMIMGIQLLKNLILIFFFSLSPLECGNSLGWLSLMVNMHNLGRVSN